MVLIIVVELIQMILMILICGTWLAALLTVGYNGAYGKAYPSTFIIIHSHIKST